MKSTITSFVIGVIVGLALAYYVLPQVGINL